MLEQVIGIGWNLTKCLNEEKKMLEKTILAHRLHVSMTGQAFEDFFHGLLRKGGTWTTSCCRELLPVLVGSSNVNYLYERLEMGGQKFILLC